MNDENADIPEPEPPTAEEEPGDLPSEQEPNPGPGSRLERIEDVLARVVTRLMTLENVTSQLSDGLTEAAKSEQRTKTEPAPWVCYSPPEHTDDLRANVWAFVEFYNATYVGRTDGRARQIPDCWDQHPGLAMELANLAATWRAANIGTAADPSKAQYWHHQWRPGAIDRMLRDWVHSDCLDGTHQPAGAPARTDRYSTGDAAVPTA